MNPFRTRSFFALYVSGNRWTSRKDVTGHSCFYQFLHGLIRPFNFLIVFWSAPYSNGKKVMVPSFQELLKLFFVSLYVGSLQAYHETFQLKISCKYKLICQVTILIPCKDSSNLPSVVIKVKTVLN